MSISKLKKEIDTVQRVLFGDKTFDEYGRSYAMLREDQQYEEMAFDSLSETDQALVLEANAIEQKYEQKALEWEKLPESVKAKEPFYEEYLSHSKITKHAFLSNSWMSEQEKKLCLDAFHVMLEARKKFDPYYISGPGALRGMHK